MFGSIVDLMAKLTLQKPGCHSWFEMAYSDLNYLNWYTLGDSEHIILSKALGFGVSMTSAAVTCRRFKRLQKRLLFSVLLMKGIDLMIEIAAQTCIWILSTSVFF